MSGIRLDVKGDGNTLFKLDWKTLTSDERWYHVDRERLERAGKEARARLQDVIDAAMGKQPLARPLKRLAQAGTKLRNRIFTSEPNPEIREGEMWGPQSEEWFRAFSAASLHLTIDQRVYIPWGLAYEGDPDALPEDADDVPLQQYEGFWCVKYRLSTVYNRIRDGLVRAPRPVDSSKRVRLMHESTWANALAHVPEDEKALAETLFNQTISSKDDFDSVWRKNKGNLDTDLLYYFGHANGTALEFQRGDRLDISDFKEQIRRHPPQDRPACIVFLNGCQTVIGDDVKGGFVEATGYQGYCGFVGAEVKIPDVFALRFGNHFVKRLLYSGQRAIDVMHDMRREHWPLSLVYNLSCHPDFRFTVETPSQPPQAGNFSIGPLGSSTI
jgi:hypothetical protein